MQNKQDEAGCCRSIDAASAACCRLYLYFFFLEGALVKVRIGDIKAVDLLSTVVLCILVSNEVIHLAKDCRTF